MAIKQVRINLDTIPHYLDQDTLILEIPTTDGPVFDRKFVSELEQKVGGALLDQALEKAMAEIDKVIVIHTLSDRVMA